jgi:hypothetical protein
MRSILDASLNPGVYPFGAIVVTIDGLAKPWIFSFFTEREAAVKCIRSARGYQSGGEEAIAAWRARNERAAGRAEKGGEKDKGGFLRWISGRKQNATRNAQRDSSQRDASNNTESVSGSGGAFG